MRRPVRLHPIEQVARLAREQNGLPQRMQAKWDGLGRPQHEAIPPVRLGLREGDALISDEEELASAIVDAPVADPALHTS